MDFIQSVKMGLFLVKIAFLILVDLGPKRGLFVFFKQSILNQFYLLRFFIY